MPRILGVSTALPRYEVSQEMARLACEKVYRDREDLRRLFRLFDHSGVRKRYTAFPVEYYLSGRSFEERNADFIVQGSHLGLLALRTCLDRAGAKPEQIDHFFTVTTTGLATPSLDALLCLRARFRPETRRWPLFGLGCAGGAGGLIRAGEVLRARPKERAVVLSVELCGQVFSPRAANPVDVVGAALFGDGAAAALVAGDDAGSTKAPRILAAESVLFEDTQHLMGWRFTSDGMRLLLSKDVTAFIRERLKSAVDGFLARSGVAAREVDYWLLHPGGRKVIDAYGETFGLGEDALHWTKSTLANVGNLSSASVLFALSDLLAAERPAPGARALMVALGPGFGAEMLVLGW
jgi:alkylresorcinol/alkylpyrone synthase